MENQINALPKVRGLIAEAAGLTEHAARLDQQAGQEKNPNAARHVLDCAETAWREVARINARIAANAAAISMIEAVIDMLVDAAVQSAERTLARRSLEDASSRLRREIGDA